MLSYISGIWQGQFLCSRSWLCGKFDMLNSFLKTSNFSVFWYSTISFFTVQWLRNTLCFSKLMYSFNLNVCKHFYAELGMWQLFRILKTAMQHCALSHQWHAKNRKSITSCSKQSWCNVSSDSITCNRVDAMFLVTA